MRASETEQARVASELNEAIAEVELALRRAGLLTRGVWYLPDLGGVLAWSKIRHPTGGVDEWMLVWERAQGEFRTPLIGCSIAVKTAAVRDGLPSLVRGLVGNRDRQIPAMRTAINVARELRGQIDMLPPADPESEVRDPLVRQEISELSEQIAVIDKLSAAPEDGAEPDLTLP